MRRIYVATSWRNQYQSAVISALRAEGHQCYDFRNPPGKAGFQWKDIEEDWQTWTTERYRTLLQTTPDAAFGFIADYRGMQWADTCLLVLPCGRSAHLEAGYFNGAAKRLVIYIPKPIEPDLIEPDLMYLMAQHICITMDEVLDALK